MCAIVLRHTSSQPSEVGVATSTIASDFPKTGFGVPITIKTDWYGGRDIREPTRTQMDESSSKRSKKADKAKDKRGKPTSKHVRQYEAILAKKR